MGEPVAVRYRVALVDDHPIFRSGVAQILRADGRLEVVGEGHSADCAEQMALELSLDVIVVDLRMPGGGFEATERVLRIAPRVGVIILSVEDETELVEEAFRRGARGYVAKTQGGSELVETILKVAQGEHYLGPQLAGRMMRRMSVHRDQPAAAPSQAFTGRQEQIMGLLIHGLSNKEIAYRLNLSEKTVKFYVTQVIKKLGVQNRVQVALYASKRGSAAAPAAKEA